MSTEKSDVTVRIMDRDYNVKCPADKVSALHKAAKYFDSKIRELHKSDKVINMDNLIIITALNISYELLAQQKQNIAYIDTMNQQILDLQSNIETALANET